jgi:hypothetical protein
MRLLTILIACVLFCEVRTALADSKQNSSSVKAGVIIIDALQKVCELIEDEAQVACNPKEPNMGCWAGVSARHCAFETCVMNQLREAGCTDWYDGFRERQSLLNSLVPQYCSFACV